MNNKNHPNWLVPLEIAKELKEIGFDMVCQNWQAYESFVSVNFTYLDRYRKNNYDITTIPTWEQVFEWFREKGFESYISIDNHSYIDEGSYYFYAITNEIGGEIDVKGDFDDYNVAREALVKALIQTYKREQYEIK